MLRKTIALSLVLTITVFLSLAYGDHRRFGGPLPGPGGLMIFECAEQIGLEEAQLDKIRSIHLNAQKEVIKLRADLEIAELELKELMQSSNPSKSGVNKKIDEISQLRARIHKIEAGARIDVMSTLTAEQMENLKEYRMKRMKEAPRGDRYRQHHEGFMGRGMGMGKMRGAPEGRPSNPPPPPVPPEPE